MPGWLRMLDPVCHTQVPALAKLTGWLVQPFRRLFRHVPPVRRTAISSPASSRSRPRAEPRSHLPNLDPLEASSAGVVHNPS